MWYLRRHFSVKGVLIPRLSLLNDAMAAKSVEAGGSFYGCFSVYLRDLQIFSFDIEVYIVFNG